MDSTTRQTPAVELSATQPMAWTRPVAGIDCGACALDIERVLGGLPGVESVEVNPASAWAHIAGQFSEPADTILQRIQLALKPLGCTLLPDDPAAQLAASQQALRQTLFRLLLAVLVWMQVMMYAWPEYFHLNPGDAQAGILRPPDAPDALSITLLRWAQWMLSVPLLLYCARPVLRSAWRGLRQWRPNLDLPAAVAILSAFVVSTEATFSAQGAVWFDSLSMFLMFLLTARYLAQRAQHRATTFVLQAAGDVPPSVKVLRDDASTCEVASASIRPGDVFVIEQGQAVPVDAVVQGSGAVWVSEAQLTGEDAAIAKQPGDVLLAGSRVLCGSVHCRATTDTAHSTLVALARQAQRAVGHKPPQSHWVDRWSLWILGALLLISIAAGLLADWQRPGDGWWVGISVLMVSCPCAISLAGPAAHLMAATRLGSQGLIIQNAVSLEQLAKVDTVVFDKTGTLTVGEQVSDVQWQEPTNRLQDMVHWLALCRPSHHPVARAVVAWLNSEFPADTVAEPVVWDTWEEIPGQGLQARIGDFHYRSTANGFARKAPGQDWQTRATFALTATLRSGAFDLVRSLQTQGFTVALWSGDRADRVAAVAAELGISDWAAGLGPAEKLQRAQALRAQGHCLLFVGDGLNDAPVLAGADVSMAVASGSPVSLRQADCVLSSSHLGLVGHSIDTARQLARILRQNMAWALTYHVLMLPLAFVGWLTPFSAGVGMAVSSLGVLLNASRLSAQGVAQSL